MRLTRVRARAPGGDAHAVRTAAEHCRTPRRRRARASDWGTPAAPQFHEEADRSSFAFLPGPGPETTPHTIVYDARWRVRHSPFLTEQGPARPGATSHPNGMLLAGQADAATPR